MKKIRLEIDALEVRSFATDTAAEARGTVRGRESPGSAYTYGGQDSCYQACFPQTHEFDTCGQTGPGCGATWDWPCYPGSYVCLSDTGC